MEIPKDKILEMIKSRGDQDQAGQAEQELPENVDTDKDQGLLAKFGIDPKDLIGGLGGKLGM
ncbi:hypothetical protein [Pseudonocardia pini]|uniref:hypothetical protein n=1 Tax=Pseudonocardia pini TaxID=2758030 RepID=UPI0015F10711|nr:hypothetical protein [Pseudonocardia pini]